MSFDVQETSRIAHVYVRRLTVESIELVKLGDRLLPHPRSNSRGQLYGGSPIRVR